MSGRPVSGVLVGTTVASGTPVVATLVAAERPAMPVPTAAAVAAALGTPAWVKRPVRYEMVVARSRKTVGDSTMRGPTKLRLCSYHASTEIWNFPAISAL